MMWRDASETLPVLRYQSGAETRSAPDQIAAEGPLEIRVEGQSVAVLMRTPGDDRELAAGFLVTENLVRSPADIFEITLCGAEEGAVVNVTLKDPRTFDRAKLTRNVFSSSSCGVCSKATLEAVRQSFAPLRSTATIHAAIILALPARLREKQ